MNDLQKITKAFPISSKYPEAFWEETPKMFLINLDQTHSFAVNDEELEKEISVIMKKDCGFLLIWGDFNEEEFDTIELLCQELETRFLSLG